MHSRMLLCNVLYRFYALEIGPMTAWNSGECEQACLTGSLYRDLAIVEL